MGVKHLFFSALMLAGCMRAVAATDSLAANAAVRTVPIGPVYFDASPPVDSALLRQLLVKERLEKKNKESGDLVKYQNTLLLRSLLNQTETSQIPDDRLISTLDLVMEEYRRENNIKSMSLILNTYGVYYGKKGETAKAIQYFAEALALKERLKDKEGMVRIADNLSALYKLAGDRNKSAVFTEYSIQVNTSLRRNADVAAGYLALAENRLLQNKYTEAEFCILKKALPLYTRTGNKAGRMKSFQSLADLYYRQQRLSEAKWFYVQAQMLAEKLNHKEALISSLVSLAEVKNALGEHEMALEDYKRAELLAVQNNYMVKLIKIKGDLGETYSQLGNYLEAGNSLDEYSRLRENLLKSVNL